MGSAERLAAKIMIMSHQEKNEFISLLVKEYRTEKEENQKLRAALDVCKQQRDDLIFRFEKHPSTKFLWDKELEEILCATK